MLEMKNVRPSVFATRVPPRVLALAAVAAGVLAPGVARADLTGDFADKLAIDAEFVTMATGATDIAFASDGRAVVTRKGGQITIRTTDGLTVEITKPFKATVDTESEKGLTGVFADPSTPNGFFFYCDNGPSDTDKHRVYKGVLNEDNTLTIDDDNPIVAAGKNPGDPGLEGPANHDGGGLFVYDNHLYVSVGDTGKNSSRPSNKYSSCLNKGNGKILRLNLDGTIPSDNPLSGESMVTACDTATGAFQMAAPDKRVYAWGLRNPWRYWVDPHTGRMWIGDVGELDREEVSISEPAASYTGQHFGYPFVEGLKNWNDIAKGGEGDTSNTAPFSESCTDISPSRACSAPVMDYGRSTGTCVIGGVIPEGCGWTDAFAGKLYYWFADNGAGFVKALEAKPDRSGVASATPVNVGTFSDAGPASIRQGPNGAIYLVNNKQGSVYEIKPKAQTGDDCVSMGGTGGTGAGGMSGGAGTTGGTSATSGGAGGTTGGTGQGAGAGGTGTAGTSSATGGRTGTGGTTGGTTPATGGAAPTTGGTGGTGGSGATGGTTPTTGGTAPTTGGTTSAAGAGSAGKGETDDKGGCGCRVGGDKNSALLAALGGLGLAAFSLRRRRSRH